jgi:predicted nucleotidyltransferase
MENKYIQKIKELVLDFLKDEEVKIVLFGSRARKDSSIFSDVDIGVMPYGKLDETRLILLREKVENLNIPYKVEIVNFSEVSPEFKEEASRDIIVWKE